MSTNLIIPGTVRDGLVVPEPGVDLPEGARVEIVVPSATIPEALEGELRQWEAASDEAWAMIDEWEQSGP